MLQLKNQNKKLLDAAIQLMQSFVKRNNPTKLQYEPSYYQIVHLYAKLKYNEVIKDVTVKEWIIKKFQLKLEDVPIKRKKLHFKRILIKKEEPIDYKELYQKFLRTAYWKKLRLEILERDSHMCRRCGSKNKLHVHHIKYKYHLKEHNHPEDLITLCSSCHNEEHRVNK